MKKSIKLTILLGTITILYWYFSSLFPIINQFYTHYIFRTIRIIYDFALASWLPFPIIYLMLILLLIYMFYKKKKFLIRFLYSINFVIFGFFWLWGYNYQRPSVAELNLIPLSNTVDKQELLYELNWTIDRINDIRTTLQNDTLPLKHPVISERELNSQCRKPLQEVLAKLNYPTYGQPVVRILYPKGILMRFKTAGIYIPHALEGHIDAGMMPLEYSYALTHEMSHAYGVTNEGECNFTAFLASMSQGNQYIQYSALLDYSLYLMHDMYLLDKKLYANFRQEFHEGYHRDVMAIRENGKKYPDILPQLRDIFYDRYLKTLGVKEGLKSYSQLVNYVIAYRKMNPQFFE